MHHSFSFGFVLRKHVRGSSIYINASLHIIHKYLRNFTSSSMDCFKISSAGNNFLISMHVDDLTSESLNNVLKITIKIIVYCSTQILKIICVNTKHFRCESSNRLCPICQMETMYDIIAMISLNMYFYFIKLVDEPFLNRLTKYSNRWDIINHRKMIH